MTANYQLSAKHPDGRIYVIGGANYEEFSQNLVLIFGGAMADKVVEDFQYLVDPAAAVATANAEPLRSQAIPPYPATATAPAFAGGAPAPGAPTCAHGARTFRTGMGKKGQWTAWFCPQPKGADQCEAVWG